MDTHNVERSARHEQLWFFTHLVVWVNLIPRVFFVLWRSARGAPAASEWVVCIVRGCE